MIKISLADFIDFVTTIGQPKYNVVKRLVNREVYHPKFDFWKPLRECIVECHRNNIKLDELDNILSKLTDKKKLKNYPPIINSYQSFLRRKKTEWFEPPKSDVKLAGMDIRLNPELGLVINGQINIIKLYFKSEKLSQNKIDIIILFMQKHLLKKEYKNALVSILDVAQKKLYNKTRLDKNHHALMKERQ